MILAIDVAYDEISNTAFVAGVLFDDWLSTQATETKIVIVEDIADYVSGAFYLRELPCILALLQQISTPIDVIVIDGYVTLGAEYHEGLGLKLWNALHQQIPVIGVAKNKFLDTPETHAVYRGESKKPLYVTCTKDLALSVVQQNILQMSGAFRIPELLRQADARCRTAHKNKSTII